MPKSLSPADRVASMLIAISTAVDALFKHTNKAMKIRSKTDRTTSLVQQAIIMDVTQSKCGQQCRAVVATRLFFITKDGKRTWMLVWTDDCDLVGESDDQL